jgi:PTS system galactitol-specific IIA component
MKGLSDYISENLVLVGLKAENDLSCISQLGNLLYKEGYVKDTYTQAAIDREKVFATGLDMGGMGVAIPHTDAVHVIKPAVAIGILEKPVLFRQMAADDDQTVEVRAVFQLAINEPQEQLSMLQSLMGLLANAELLKNLQKAPDPQSVIRLIRKELSKTD